MSNKIPLARVRWRLATTWFCGAALLVVILLILTFSQRYSPAIRPPSQLGDEELIEALPASGIVREVWEWFMPHVLPTVVLMISILGADAIIHPAAQKAEDSAEDDSKKTATRAEAFVDSRFYWLVQIVSLAYFVILAFSIFLPDFVGGQTMTWLLLSNVWLSPLQSLVVAGIGVLFFQKKDESKKKD